MTYRPIGIAALFVLALAGCGEQAAEAPAETRKMTASSPFVDQLKGLSELNRGLALRRAIQDSGSACKKVEQSGYQEDYKNLSMWTARCSDTKDWAIFIAPNGDVQVRKCTDAAQLQLPACRIDELPA